MAAAFAAVNPFMIWYSQEAREYMLLVALCAASLLFFARAWNRAPAGRDLLWWAVLSALALLTQYFAGLPDRGRGPDARLPRTQPGERAALGAVVAGRARR